MPYFKIYLTDEEREFIRAHDKGFLRKLVQHSMDRARREREKQIMAQPVREERHERFEEVP